MDAYHYHITLLTLEIIQKKFPNPVDFNAKGKKFNIIIIFLLLTLCESPEILAGQNRSPIF